MDSVAADEARVIDRWALARFPFEHSAVHLEWPADSQFAEAEARLEYLIERPGAVGLLAVERGCGSPLLLESLQTLLPGRSRTTWWLDASAGDEGQFLGSLIEQTGAPPVKNADQCRRLVLDELSARSDVGQRVVVVIENLHRMSPRTAGELRWLTKAGESVGLTSIGVTRAPITELVRDEFLDLVDLRLQIGPLTAAETDWYVRQCLAAAGARGDVFDAGSLRSVHDRTGGVLRRIQRLCRFALLAALADEADTVTVEIVDRVAAEIG